MFWKTCTFQEFKDKRQAYLDLLAEEMAKKGFKRAEKVKLDIWGVNLFIENNDLVFETPDGQYWIGIRTASAGEDLRVEFAHTGNPGKTKQANFLFIISFLLGAFGAILSAFIIKEAFLPADPPLWTLSIPLVILFSVCFGPLLFYYMRIQATWDLQVRQLLVKIAGSMGSKQTTPFKRKMIKRGWARD